MFTGIITDIGTVTDIRQGQGDKSFTIKTSFDLSDIPIGASIACSGCCLTVVSKTDHTFDVDVSKESLDITTLKSWQVGTRINLEKSLKMGDEMGGHMVSGHVDGVAILRAVKEEGDSHRLRFDIPEKFAKFIAPKGSVALDGISLTVNEVEGCSFGVNIIPHTWQVTTIGSLQEGDTLNFEVDTIARYVARYASRYQYG